MKPSRKKLPQDLQRLGNLVRRLSHIKRFSGTPVINQQSVAEHSFYTALYALLIYGDYKLACKALVHDLPEVFTGDLVYPVKRKNKEISRELDRSGKRELLTEFKGTEISKLFKISEEDKRKIKLLDIYDVYKYAENEIRTGNSHFTIVKKKASEGLNEISEVGEQIRKKEEPKSFLNRKF